MENENIIERDVYKKIKAMNRNQLSALLTDMYMSGLCSGETVELNFDNLKADIGAIKGIGNVRLEEIMKVISSYAIRKV